MSKKGVTIGTSAGVGQRNMWAVTIARLFGAGEKYDRVGRFGRG